MILFDAPIAWENALVQAINGLGVFAVMLAALAAADWGAP